MLDGSWARVAVAPSHESETTAKHGQAWGRLVCFCRLACPCSVVGKGAWNDWLFVGRDLDIFTLEKRNILNQR